VKFGCSLEMINMRTSGPNFIIKLSKPYWVEMFKLMAAAGFKGIELPYNPYSSDPIAFEIGRCGMPISAFAVNAKYGSVKSFLDLLKSVGIEEVTSVHINANDVMLELLATDDDFSKFFEMLESLAEEAIEFLGEIGGKGLVISPTPEIGVLTEYVGKGTDGWQPGFVSKTVAVLNRIGELATEGGVKAVMKNEFWGLARGAGLDDFMKEVDAKNVSYSPDLAHLAIAGSNPIQTVRKYGDRLSFVRFSDTDFEDIQSNFKKPGAETPVNGSQRVFCDLGEGAVDLPGVYRAMRESGYDGWVICESKMTLNVYRALLKMRWYLDNVILKA
jgi:sugar phosphate isomerase/epimerase